MAAPRVERRLAAIVAADVVGYARLIEQDETGTLVRLKALRQEVIEPLIAGHRGRIVKLMGDGALIEFPSASEAVQAAVEVQQAVVEHEQTQPTEVRIRFRIGVSLGDVICEDGDIFGEGVNLAARLEQLAEPGGICITRNVHEQARHRLPVGFVPLGRHRIKNVAEPVEVWRVQTDGVAAKAWRKHYRVYRWRIPAATAVLALTVAGGSWWLWPATQTLATKPAIAVLPFDNFGEDAATGRLADGITEDVITDLARFRDLDVIARNSTAVYKGKPVDIRQIGKDLGVGYVLEGSIQRQADHIRVSAQLIDTENGAHVWTERWDRPSGDVFAVQAEIADATAARIGGYGVAQQADRAKARRKLAGSLTAYDLTLLALEAKQKSTREQSEEAIQLATRAIEADPDYARAWLARAWGHGALAQVTGDFAAERPKMEADVRRALALDPNEGEAHAALGEALGYAGRLADAKAEYGRALALNPSSADIGALFAGWSGNFGEPERGARYIDRAIRLNPNFPPWYRNIMPDWMLLAAAYGHLGDARNARRAAEALLKAVPDFSAELGFNFGYVP